MFTRTLVHLLAKALVAGDAEPDAVVERATRILGHRWQWLRPLAVRYLETFSKQTRPRYREAHAFLKRDEGFDQAVQRHFQSLEIAQWLQDSPTMLPVKAAENWLLPPIATTMELANWLQVKPGELDWFADLGALGYKRRNVHLRHYWYRVLRKDSGNIRLIEAPKERLKKLQQQVLSGILEQIPMLDAVHGFRKGRSIQTFCAPHVGQRTVLKMDLQDFFPSISGVRLQALFRTFGYPERVADLLGGLCSNATPKDIWDGASWDTRMQYARPHLPQGAPTSPALANLCFYGADCRLRGLAEAVGARYTRYADDLAFSGDAEFGRCVERFGIQVAAIVAEEGFAVNHRKTRVMRRSVRQHLAGLVVNERANVRRTDYDTLKAILTNCVRFGVESQNREGHSDFRAHLTGRVAFVKAVNAEKGRKLERLLDKIQS